MQAARNALADITSGRILKFFYHNTGEEKVKNDDKWDVRAVANSWKTKMKLIDAEIDSILRSMESTHDANLGIRLNFGLTMLLINEE